VPVEQAATTIATGDKIMINRRFTSLPICRCQARHTARIRPCCGGRAVFCVSPCVS
jgi:hypothetical protein